MGTADSTHSKRCSVLQVCHYGGRRKDEVRAGRSPERPRGSLVAPSRYASRVWLSERASGDWTTDARCPTSRPCVSSAGRRSMTFSTGVRSTAGSTSLSPRADEDACVHLRPLHTTGLRRARPTRRRALVQPHLETRAEDAEAALHGAAALGEVEEGATGEAGNLVLLPKGRDRVRLGASRALAEELSQGPARPHTGTVLGSRSSRCRMLDRRLHVGSRKPAASTC